MKERGFTLIEMMIAITLVAAISTTMLFAIRAGLITLQKVDDRLMSNRRVMSVERIVRESTGRCDAGDRLLLRQYADADFQWQ